MKFLSKHIKLIFLILIIASLILGLRYKNSVPREYSQTEFLMDTQCTITAYGKDAKEAVSAAFDEVAHLHSLTNFFDSQSDVSKINSALPGEIVTVDSHIINILSVALDVSQSSKGAFDVTVAPLSLLWNFGKNQTPPTGELISQTKSAVNYKNLVIDTQNNTVTKKSETTKIDLGGAAKGYAADCAMEILKKYNVSGAIADLGGNVSCFGDNPKTRSRQWRIGIQVPFSPTGEYDEVITLLNGCVVTSGSYQRNFTHNKTLYHHILDPKTGYPANQPYSSVTIVGKSALLADCLSTACYVLGKEEGTALAKKYNAEITFQ